jgi:putative SOS response-associated peptidase YedK
LISCHRYPSSFWEWSGEHPDDPKKKQRHCIRRGDNQPTVLAGLRDYAVTADGPVTSFTILTRAAGADMAPLHTREPVLLGRDQWKPWVDCEPMPELMTPTALGLLRPVVETRAYA